MVSPFLALSIEFQRLISYSGREERYGEVEIDGTISIIVVKYRNQLLVLSPLFLYVENISHAPSCSHRRCSAKLTS
jgi:hypothetical protein